MSKIDLWLDDDDVRDASATGGGFVFAIPSDAATRGNFADPNDDKAKATWTQVFTIIESKQYMDTTKDKQGNEYDSVCFEVKFQVAPDAVRPKTGEADPNAGRTHTAWYRIVPKAMKNPQHPKFKANNFNNGKLTGIVRSVWGSEAIPQGTKLNLGDYFGTDVLLKSTVLATVRNSKYEGEPKTELVDFVPLELRG